MEKVTVARLGLMKTIERNRAKHERIYEKAMAGYKKKRVAAIRKVIGLYQRDLKALAKGALPSSLRDHGVRMHVPQEFTDEYDRAIGMLKMHTEDTITLNKVEFDQYVRDEWGWSDAFATSNSAYAGGVLRKAKKLVIR